MAEGNEKSMFSGNTPSSISIDEVEKSILYYIRKKSWNRILFENVNINSFWYKFGLVFYETKRNADVLLLRETKQYDIFP